MEEILTTSALLLRFIRLHTAMYPVAGCERGREARRKNFTLRRESKLMDERKTLIVIGTPGLALIFAPEPDSSECENRNYILSS